MVPSCWLRHIALAGAAALAVLTAGAPGSVHAQNDGTVDNENSILNLERRIWGGVVRGLGLRSGDEPVIEYRERSPLVVPPTRELPPPQAKAVPKDANWPKDPDQARRRANIDAAKKSGGNVDTSRVIDRQGNALPPDQLNTPGGSVSTASGPPPTGGVDGNNMEPSALGYFGGLFTLRSWGFGGYRDEVGTFTNEPSRNALTAPPTGYQTPSTSHPYGTTRRIERTAPKQFDPAGNN